MSLVVMVLTFNEESHLARCLESVRGVSEDVVVVDSFSSDRTTEIAERLGAKVLFHKWENNHAAQFNWALDNCPIAAEWCLRLDADEYLTPELQEELRQRLPRLPERVTGVVVKRRHVFLGRWVRRGVYPVKLLRIFRTGRGRCEQRLMDEHIAVDGGDIVEFEHDIVDHNVNDLSWWTAKHNGYAFREALDLLDVEYGLLARADGRAARLAIGQQATRKRQRKQSYARAPLFFRSTGYFFWRYVLRGGFLDGVQGFLWHGLQGWWYRTLVDARIYEIKQACGSDVAKMRVYLKERYGVDCSKENPFSKD